MFAVVTEMLPPPSLASSASAWHAQAGLHLPMLLDGGDDPAAGSGTSRSEDEQKFVRHHRLGKIGVVTMLSSIGVDVIGAVVLVGGTLACGNQQTCGGAIAGVGIIVVGAIGSVTGEALMFVGGIGAAYDGRRLGLPLTPTLGWVGLGLVAGAEVLSLGFVGSQSAITYVFDAAGLAGFICGAVQLGEDGRAGRDKGLLVAIVPMPNGIRLAGNF